MGKLWLKLAGLQALVLWQFEHWPLKCCAGGAWQAAQSVWPVWSKVALRQLPVSVWQFRHAPLKWLAGGPWQAEQSVLPIPL